MIDAEDRQLFRAGEFEGPLDLLLYLIRKSEINIYDIPIAQITEQYLNYLDYATGINLENITEFYVLAATLLHIKSQTLLPVEVDLEDEAEDPRRELVDRLIEYQKFKKISEMMAEKALETEWVIERTRKQRILPFPEDDDLWQQIEVWDLLKTFSTLMASLTSERIIDLFEEVSINEKLTLINELLETRKVFLFTDLIVHRGSVMDVVCAFLAVLEAVKMKSVKIYQNRMFGDIQIRAMKEEAADGA